MCRSSLFVVVGLAAALPGCIPLPIGHTTYQVPHTTGTLSAGGDPVAGVEVWQVGYGPYGDRPCEAVRDTAAVAVTETDGSFSLPAVARYQEWLLVGMVDHFRSHSLCFGLDGGVATAVVQFGPAALPAEVSVACEVIDGSTASCDPAPDSRRR